MKWCKHCGSRNHDAFSCTKQDQTYTPTAEELAELAPPKPEPLPTVVVQEEPSEIFESVPRYRGCPPICTKANLPSFVDEDAAKKFHNQFDGSHYEMKEAVVEGKRLLVPDMWKCDHCDGVHYRCIGRGPSGGSSGHDERGKYPRKNFVPFMRKSTLTPSRLDDLPRHEVEPEPEKKPEEKKKLYKKPKQADTVKRANELF